MFFFLGSSEGETEINPPSPPKVAKSRQKRSPSRSPISTSTPASDRKVARRGGRGRGRGRGGWSKATAAHSDQPETPARPGQYIFVMLPWSRTKVVGSDGYCKENRGYCEDNISLISYCEDNISLISCCEDNISFISYCKTVVAGALYSEGTN